MCFLGRVLFLFSHFMTLHLSKILGQALKQPQTFMVHNRSAVSGRHGINPLLRLHTRRCRSPSKTMQMVFPVLVPNHLPLQLGPARPMQRSKIMLKQLDLGRPSILDTQRPRDKIRHIMQKRIQMGTEGVVGRLRPAPRSQWNVLTN